MVAKSTLEKERARAKILTEIRIHRSVANRHVVRFVRCFEDAANVYIIMGGARRLSGSAVSTINAAPFG